MKKKAPKESPVPSSSSPPPAPVKFPIVGIGASAGGLAAFEAFFSGMPPDKAPGMAFVLIQHLAPNHKSLLAELIQRYTRMEVFQVEDGMTVRINCVYIIPPNFDLALFHRTLQLLPVTQARGHHLPIDSFFCSLAADQHEQAIGIVLSGTGHDGTAGLRAINAEGGLVMAQKIGSGEFDGMPQSAIDTGLMDFVLAPAEMPAQLISYATWIFNGLRSVSRLENAEASLKRIFHLLRAQTGHDFSQYKPSTIHRRLERRLAVNAIEGIEDYVKYAARTPVEVEALFCDLLIGVTQFFRDPKVFEELETVVIPNLFKGRGSESVIRVWSAGCSTGEEAYSLAILLQERFEALNRRYTVQIFATDIDPRAIAVARAGLYPSSIAAQLTPDRLARFFTMEPDGQSYRIHKTIRDLLIFSPHNLIKDPPFSKLDLISCRNLLIYLGADLQKRLIPTFHYALKPDGVLLLGSSEGIGDFKELFTVLDQKAKLYLRRGSLQRVSYPVVGEVFQAPADRGPAIFARVEGRGWTNSPEKIPLRELIEQELLKHYGPTGALVSERGDILYVQGRTGMYLEPSPGTTKASNILAMARQGLLSGLLDVLRQAAKTKQIMRRERLNVKTNGHFTSVDLTVRPISMGSGEPLYLVIFEETPTSGGEVRPEPSASERVQAVLSGEDEGVRIAELRKDLLARDVYIQATQEELEGSNEKLKSAIEEMKSVNEELQSSNEELETSKEEMQSLNEELATVNTELQTKVTDLSQVNADMNNLLSGSGIATIFVDYQLRIMRFTPAATAVINLIRADEGRPLAHIVSNLVGYEQLLPDVRSVLETFQPRERDVETGDGKSVKLRIIPYRTLENVIEGAVLTFIDVTGIKRVELALQDANARSRLAVVLRDSHDAVTVHDLTGRIVAWNPGAVRNYGWSEAEALALNLRDRIPEELREGALARLRQLSMAEVLEPYKTQRLTKDGRVLAVSIISTALLDEASRVYAIATTERMLLPS